MHILLKLFLVFLAVSNINAHVIPVEDQDLVRGFFDGLGLRTFFNLTSCSLDFNLFALSALENLNGLAWRSHGESVKRMSKTLEIFGTLVDKCEGAGVGMAKLVQNLTKIFYNPKTFLSQAAKNVVSISVVSKYFEFLAEITTGFYYNAGKSLGNIFYSLVDVNMKAGIAIDEMETKFVLNK